MALQKTTELDAINTMLGTIGESPINSLDNVSDVADAVTARQILNEIAVVVLEEGWHFNTEVEFELTPSLPDGYIYVPENCIEVDTSEYSLFDVALRGNRLYDRKNKTYKFTDNLKCDMVILLPFDELPQAARHYVTVRAARVFQQRVVGSEQLGVFSEKDEVRARVALKRYDAKTGDYNILTGNYTVMRVIDR